MRLFGAIILNQVKINLISPVAIPCTKSDSSFLISPDPGGAPTHGGYLLHVEGTERFHRFMDMKQMAHLSESVW